MQSYIHLKIAQEKINQIEKERKSNSLFSRINKFMSRSVSYYQDKDLEKLGNPYIWIN